MHSLHIARKLGVYQALYRINKSFANVLTQCNELQELRILEPRTARRYQSLTQEVQAEINRGLAHLIASLEARVHSRLVTAREAEEISPRTTKPRKGLAKR